MIFASVAELRGFIEKSQEGKICLTYPHNSASGANIKNRLGRPTSRHLVGLHAKNEISTIISFFCKGEVRKSSIAASKMKNLVFCARLIARSFPRLEVAPCAPK